MDTPVKEDKPPREKRAVDLNKLTARDKKRLSELQGLYMTGAIALMPFSPKDAELIMMSAESCATSWVRAAKVNESIGKAIDRLITGSVWSAILMSHASLAIGIMNNHNMLSGKKKEEIDEDGNTQPAAATSPFSQLFRTAYHTQTL